MWNLSIVLAECDGIEPSPATNQWNSFQGCLLTMNSTLHNFWSPYLDSNQDHTAPNRGCNQITL